jgi:hypothetical protein
MRVRPHDREIGVEAEVSLVRVSSRGPTIGMGAIDCPVRVVPLDRVQ